LPWRRCSSWPCDETIVFIDLPGSVSSHANASGETVTISIGSTFSIPEPYPQTP